MIKVFLLCICAFVFYANSEAEPAESWQIVVNDKVVFKGNSDHDNPTVKLKPFSVKATDKITIRYFMTEADNSWKRTFYLNDESEKNFVTIGLNKQNGSVSFKATNLKELIEKKKTIYIHTVSIPKDPALAASVRVRRVLLCRVEWNNQ
jgi:hypothetical protein